MPLSIIPVYYKKNMEQEKPKEENKNYQETHHSAITSLNPECPDIVLGSFYGLFLLCLGRAILFGL